MLINLGEDGKLVQSKICK